MASKQYTFDVFLSCSSADKIVVTQLAMKLRKDGLRVWFDDWEIHKKALGKEIPALIEKGLEQSLTLVFCMSRTAFESDWPIFEAQTYQFRDPLNADKRFIPIRLDDAPIPLSLAQCSYVNWMAPSDDDYFRLRDACLPPPQSSVAKRENVPRRRFEPPQRTVARSKALLAFLVNGTKLYYAEADGSIWFCETSDGAIPQKTPIKCRRVFALAFSGDRIIVGSRDGQLLNVTVDDKRRSYLEDKNTPLSSLSTDAKGFVYSGSDDKSVRKWNIDTGKVVALYKGHTDRVGAIAANEHWLISGSDDGTVRIWEHNGKCVRILEGHTGAITSAAISVDGRFALSGGADTTLRLWDTWSGFCVRIFEGHTDSILSIAINPNQRHVLTGAGDMTIRLWDISNGKCCYVLDGHQGNVSTIQWLSNQRAISADHINWYFWNLNDFNFDVEGFVPSAGEGVDGNLEGQVQYTNAKVLLVGESGAGKSSLAIRLATNEWNANMDSTIGAWATHWPLPLTPVAGIEREIWLWDFGGQSDQRIIHQLYMADAAIAVLVFNGQKDDLFESIGQWDRDVNRASPEAFAKILVAARKDAGSLKFSRRHVEQFVEERRFTAFLETSAKTGEGCDALRSAIIDSIEWNRLPGRSSPILFKRLKERIVSLKDAGHVLMRFNDLRDRIRLEGENNAGPFSDAQLSAVLSLLAGPGIVAELKFGGWILFKPELINFYGQALIRTIRDDPSELGCILEEKVLGGELKFSERPQITKDEERFILLAMHRQLVERGLCLRQQTDAGPLLVLPAFYRRQRPEMLKHYPVTVSYEFDGASDEIHATIVVFLIHTKFFKQDELWKDAADFKTRSGKYVGIRFSALREGKGKIDVYADKDIGLGETIQFISYVHEHLEQRAKNVIRKRHYRCPNCGEAVIDSDAVIRRLNNNQTDIICVYCEDRVPLWDELEELYRAAATEEETRGLAAQVEVVLDNESKERVLVGDVMSAVALAGHIPREKPVGDHGIDMEIEFKDNLNEATGEMLYLQLKSGDSYLQKRVTDGALIFKIPNQRHVTYWMNQKFPVLLVIRNSKGEIAWMEIRDHLKEITVNGKKKISQIVFKGEAFNAQSINKWKQKLLKRQ